VIIGSHEYHSLNLSPIISLLATPTSQTSFSVSSMQLPMLYPTPRSMKAGYHRYCITTFTGWMLLSGFSSEWLQQFISVCTAWLQRTWLNCVRLSLRQQVVVAVFGPSQPATWSYHAADCQPTAPVRSVLPVQSAGMPLVYSLMTLIVLRHQPKTFLFCK